METGQDSNARGARTWFRRLTLAQRAGLVLAAFVVGVFVLAFAGATLERSRESARTASPLRMAVGSPPDAPLAGRVADQTGPPGRQGALPAAREASADFAAGAPESLPSLETWARQLILTAAITLEVEDVRAAYDRIQVVAASEGALVTAASLQAAPARVVDDRQQPGYGHASVVLRVPQSRFHAVRQRLLGLAPDLGGKVAHDEVTSQDVTEEYVDLQARLRNWRAQEAQLLEVMRQARKIPDILAVRNQLAQVQQEIERLSGRLRFLENRVELSTITIEVNQTGAGPAPVTIASTWKNAGRWVTAAVLKSVKDVVYVLGLMAVAVVYLFPFAVIAGIIWAGVRAVRKRVGSRPVA
ncbi:MAG TPA: DUF4349 domain-containing protein [Armatimonadota bacterium]|nr:DUF4349 domain-containing protein [Armatimonadota bacterium]